jgi:tetratricopeptide (TPR) repeat protein/transcriptional regulator with XRE-family HTH domain
LLTQEQLAAHTGLSARTIRRLESNALRQPRATTIRVLADRLGLTPAEQGLLLAAVPDGARADTGEAASGAVPQPADQPDGRDELPADLTDFTGRTALVDEIIGALVDQGATDGGVTRVVGISGPPGVGKTAVAIRVGHLLGSRFPDGRLYLDLRGMEDRSLPVGDALGRLLRWSAGADAALPTDLDERAALFRSTVAHRRVLIILDNAHSEAQVRQLLPGGPGCAVLLTSRRPLAALDAVTGFDLDVLPPDDALRLVSRIVGPDRLATDPAAGGRITRLCGNLPLAIRIACSRLVTRPHWTLRRMADRLADEGLRLDALSVGDRAVRISIELSHHALDPQSRQLFCLLGVLTDTDIPSWVAATLLDLPDGAAETLMEDLVDARLVEVSDSGHGPERYTMHSLVRLFARERARADRPEDEVTKAAQRLIGGWLNLAEQVESRLPGGLPRLGSGAGPRSAVPAVVTAEAVADPVTWFERERLTLTAAVETACGLGLDELAWDLAGCVGRYLELRGDFELWQDLVERALVTVRCAGNRVGEAHLLRGLGEIWLDLDRYPEAFEVMTQALNAFEELGEPAAVAHMHRAIGGLERMRGNNVAALERLMRALVAFRESDDRVGLADTMFALGALRRNQGLAADALVWYEQALDIEEQLGNRFNQALLLCCVGSALCAQERVSEARATLVRALAMARDVQHSEAFALSFLGEADILAGDTAAAREHLTSALEIFQDAGERYGEAVTLRNFGELHLALGLFDRSRAALDQALELFRQIDSPPQRARTLVTLGRLELASGDRAAAFAAWRAADQLFTRMGSTERDTVRRLLRDAGA